MGACATGATEFISDEAALRMATNEIYKDEVLWLDVDYFREHNKRLLEDYIEWMNS